MTRIEDAAVTRLARAKVNLNLHVVAQRQDGYHELDSLVAFAGLGDSITVEPADELSLTIDGPYAATLGDQAESNLVLRAARALADHAGREPAARISLDKQLPVAAGLGGGSADAAATLLALRELWGLSVTPDDLAALALTLGADIPICLYAGAAYISGIGERIGPAPHLPSAWLVLASPGEALSTAAVFRRLAGATSHPAHRWDRPPRDAVELARRLSLDGNDLESPARALYPAIGAVLSALADTRECLLARMSGSGATCFGLYASMATAKAAAARIAAAHPGWWVRTAVLEG